MEVTAYQLNEYLDQAYGREVDQEQVESDALDAIENDKVMWDVIADWSDMEAVVGVTRAMIYAADCGNDASLLIFAKSLARELKDAAIRKELA